MQSLNRQRIPLLFLAALLATYTWFYMGNTPLNNYGSYKPEWPLLIDAFIVLPIVCYLCLKDKKEALLKAVAYAAIMILFGAYLIPAQQKFIWGYLEQVRYLVLALVLIVELVIVGSVIAAIRVKLNDAQDPDQSITNPLKRWLKAGPVFNLMQFDMRMWVFCLFANKINPKSYTGQQHFFYAKKDDAQSNAFGFIMLMAFEVPIAHLVLHFAWSPLAANVVTLLTLFGLVLFIGEYRAMSRRPISLTDDTLIVRYGLFNPLHIELSNIQSIDLHNTFVPRQRHVARYNFSGAPNIAIKLHTPMNGKSEVYIGVDEPKRLLQSIKNQTAE